MSGAGDDGIACNQLAAFTWSKARQLLHIR